jgi:hypothetical protein
MERGRRGARPDFHVENWRTSYAAVVGISGKRTAAA